MAASPAPGAGTRAWSERVGLAGLALLVIACWMLIHPYRGITHDATLYTLLALSHLHPGSLDHDLFVRLGVQNEYTVFSPLYASAIHHLGLEPAAAALTLLTHIAFLGAAWLLARQVCSARGALLGVGLLMVVPAYYGWGKVFAYTESFLTPRQPAEVFALLGLTAALTRRQLLAACAMAASLLLHPIIAAAAIALWATLFLALPRPRLASGIVLTGSVLLIVLSATVTFPPFAHFDGHWLTILQQRLKYLFPSEWPAVDWGPVVVPLCTLLVGAVAAKRRPVRELCLAAVLAVTFGTLMAIVESDWLHVVVAAQAQIWRWLWLSGVLAALFLPVIASDCWRAGGLGRAAVVLIAATWVDTTGTFTLVMAFGACTCVLAARGALHPRLVQAMLLVSFLLLGTSLALVVVQIRDQIVQSTWSSGSPYGRCLEAAQLLADHGVLPGLLLMLACWLLEQGTQGALLVIALGVAACGALLPQAFDRWTQTAYPPRLVAAFAPWRAAIPPGTSVLWPEDPPLDAWFVLERPSYWSLYQMAGMVFSRDDAMIGTRLESRTTPMLSTIRPESENVSGPERLSHRLADICTLPGIKFFASWNKLGPTPYPPVTPDAGHPGNLIYLYHCGAAKD